MLKRTMKAPFLSLDGVDGVGKSTQCRLLADALRRSGWDVVQCVDPGGTKIGQELRDILLSSRHSISLPCEAFLFMASRAQLVAEVIRPALEAGKAVLSDRYLLANVVYQGYAGGLDVDTLWTIGNLATAGFEPDMTFILDLPLDVARQRRKPRADRMESRGDEYFAKVRDGFLTEAQRKPGRIRVIDATLTIDDVHAEIARQCAGWLKLSHELG
jgi:dTMP kinase